ncbi:CW-type domain-containing protein [Heracleum sosnowskyi]|uniref:CW-type domain-containing protein n=1 Tax=Heracleum sosnowskyi TaxID=360622 RepID=A0AAD8GZV1_9APIA|nr:CW-type domain-containing protein [Heracleum sosnowskyi]
MGPPAQTILLPNYAPQYIAHAPREIRLWIGRWLRSGGTKVLGLGLGFGGEINMEETELEEGEACLNKNAVDSSFDPDVALSYIDEKLENVLGHFQKDFEGGVSAENLGSKFGGYGSFLPTYQRSPVWSHPKTPPKVQNHNASKSPNNLTLEGARGHSVSSSASLFARHGSTALGMATLPVPRASFVDDCVKREVTMPITSAENKSGSQADQKNFKVRIKMVSDEFSTKKNAEIYSGLGLDVSPTSSFEDSPTDGELAREHQNLPEESPTSILEIMTSLPFHGILLLSPLHDDLTCLTDKEMHSRKSRAVPVRHRGSQEGNHLSVNGSDSSRSDRKLVGEKKPKSSEKKSFTVELKNNNVHNKETDVDTPVSDEIVSNALRLPLLSNSYRSVAESAKDTARNAEISRVVNKSEMEENFHDFAKDEPRGPASVQENGSVGKANGNTVSRTKKTNSYDDESGYLDKGERQGFNPELMDHARQRNGQKFFLSAEDDMKVSSGKENSSSGSKRKSKGTHNRGAEITTEVRNANTKTDVSGPISRKNTSLKTHTSTSEVNDSKKDIGKAKDRYKDFFGDLEELGDDDITDDMPSIDKSSNYAAVAKGNGEFNNVFEDRSSSKKIDQLSRSEASTRATSSLVPPTGNRLIPDVAAPVVPFVNEDWVCCDKCQKWRLLPAGKNPQSLPKTWVCNMLNWLDGMNRCSISEEETSKAVLALHQTFATAPVHGGQNSQNIYSGVELSGDVDQSLNDVGGRKKHGSKDVYNTSSHNGSSLYLDSKKKIPQAPAKTQSLNGENHSPSFNEVDFELSGHSSGLVRQKRKHRRIENSIPLANPVEGDSKSSKIRNSSEINQEFSKAPKKLKAGGIHIDEDWKSDYGDASLKMWRSSTSGLPMDKSQEHQHKHDDHPKDLKRDLKFSVGNSEDRTRFSPDASLLRTENYIDRNAKKRKIREYQESQLYTTSCSNEIYRLEDRRDSMEETSERNHLKEKKARVSKSGGKQSSMSKGSGRIENKGRSLKDQQAGADLESSQVHRSLDVVDLVKKDIGSSQPPVAATSSSSKVSSSRKSKNNFQEVKGSPVESVSSSPLRVSNQDKFMLTRRDLGGKGDTEEAVILATSSPRKGSDGEDGAQIDQLRMVQKNVSITAINHGSLDSSMHDFQDRTQSHISRRKALPEAVSTHRVTDTLKPDQYPCKPLISEQCADDESGKRNQYHNNGSSRKFGKGSSSRSNDKSHGTRSECEKGNLREADSNGYADHSSNTDNSKARSKLQEKIALNSEKVEKNIFFKNELAKNPLTESGKKEAQSKWASSDISDVRLDISNHGSEHDRPMDCNTEKSSKRFPTDKTDRVDVSGKGKSHSLPPSGRCQNEMTRWPQPINGIQKDSGVNLSAVSTSEGDDALKANKQIKKSENRSGNGNHFSNSRNPTNGHKGRDIDAPSPIRRDSTSQAANNAVKEAKDLKHLADRLKNSGSTLESMGLYFQAALKFLYGASLLESINNENSRHGEAIQSMQMYSSTAKLCEFCAHEYEKFKDMASAALAYKCVEVAYLRVIYSSHSSVSKDRHELQTALQIVPPGESPSSSASDVDNLNNIATADKVTVTKGVNSPQVAGNHVIPVRNRPNFVRLLNFVQDINFAMEASRKSQIAFVTANSREEAKYQEGLPSVKKALDFNFQDMDGFLRLYPYKKNRQLADRRIF